MFTATTPVQHTPRESRMGDDMTETPGTTRTHFPSAAGLVAILAIALVATAAGAADRVVLGEYFTNLY